ncbi:Dehydrogenase/reductase SDR family member 4 [Hondaea fermentalgiana]|uniref:Dehydrogenase/reductase SDR family member 4 n=1 Tax=Hondaea fermentalgiana TaxID=2315210 RepID=A0A2R5GG50_9STRA|nr:Dehydrogenase/reductase SDR family member 4 [Hondaea fermentalgiana]|eukprot:GBG29575.1 Dehydrogenase/reductase SDR family member 4 [Hondaea fermentalgiana]
MTYREPEYKEGRGWGEPVMSDPSHSCKRYNGKNVVVTAGTLGIGRAMVERFCEEGARVFLCSRKAPNVEQTVEELRKKGYNVGGTTCNVGESKEQEDFLRAAIDFFGEERIDTLVSNAGVNPKAGPTNDMTEEIFDKIFNINVKSYFVLVKLAMPYLKRGSSVLFVSSVGGFLPSPPLGLYGVSKTAVIALGKVLANELGPMGIRVNTVCPGVVRTKMAGMLWKSEDADGAAKKNGFLQRFGDPVDISGIAAFLCSDDASYMTGESVLASGGNMSRL